MRMGGEGEPRWGPAPGRMRRGRGGTGRSMRSARVHIDLSDGHVHGCRGGGGAYGVGGAGAQ
eukprot:3138520-Prymnesium_polylepis.1